MAATNSMTKGFTLIEVLIALLVSNIALLGLAAGQLKSLQYATNSFNYTVSLIQANNAAERIWADICMLQDGRLAFDEVYLANLQPEFDKYNLVIGWGYPTIALSQTFSCLSIALSISAVPKL